MSPICRRGRGRGCVTGVPAAMSEQDFLAALSAQVKAVGGHRICRRIARAIHAAAACPGGIAAERDAALERAGFAYQDWMAALAAIAEVEARMVAVLDELHMTHLIATIPGLSAVSAAAILAETGDPARYDSPHTPVWSARRDALTSRNSNQLHDGQARAAAAAALLRQLFVVITKRVAWDPAIAAGTTAPEGVTARAA